MSESYQVVKWRLRLFDNPLREQTGDVNLISLNTDEKPCERIDRLGLGSRFRDAFLHSEPIEYGWFASSPLNAEQMMLLRIYADSLMVNPPRRAGSKYRALATEVQTGFRAEEAEERRPCRIGADVAEFRSALELAGKADLQMHVELTPPGHVDFGFYTVHCHCPRCKSPAPVERWQKEYPAEPYDCPACGFTYALAETTSHRRSYPFSKIVCSMCDESFGHDQFSEEENARLEKNYYHRHFGAEMRTIRSIKALFERFADPEELAQLPRTSELVRRVLTRSLADSSGAAHRSALKFLLRNRFHLDREESAESGARERDPNQETDLVFCPSCGASLL
jgi:transposase-like protein